MSATPRPGDTVTGIPVGQKRRQTMVVTVATEDYLVGLLVSRKYPGDYRGRAVMETTAVEVAPQ